MSGTAPLSGGRPPWASMKAATDATATCVADGAYSQALGIAIETRRLDKLEELVGACPEAERAPLLRTLGVREAARAT